MLRAFDFQCPTHGRFEEFISIPPIETGTVYDSRRDPCPQPCPQCQAESPRVLSGTRCAAPKYLAFRGDIRKRYSRT